MTAAKRPACESPKAARQKRTLAAAVGEGSRSGHFGCVPKRDIVGNLLASGTVASKRAGAITKARHRKPAPIDLPERFSIGWPPGYTPYITAEEIARAKGSKKSQQANTESAESGLGHAGLDMGLPGSYRGKRPGRM